MEIKENRNLTIDILKGLGIIFVVLGHCERGTGITYLSPYSFHMPLFIFCSGYFYKQINAGKLNDIKTMLRKMILPVIVWGSVYYIIQALVNGTVIREIQNGSFLYSYVKEAIIASFWGNYAYNIFMIPCWFVGCLFLIRIYFTFIHARIMCFFKQSIAAEKIMLCIYFVLCLCTIHISKTLWDTKGEVQLLPKVILRVCFGTFFYYLGYMLHKYEKYVFKFIWFVLAVCIVTASVLKNGGFVLDFWMDRMLFNTEVLPVVSSLLGIIFFFILAHILANSNCYLLGIVGKNSMNVLIHHLFLMYCVNLVLVALGIISFEQLKIVNFDDIPKIYFRYKSGLIWPIYCGVSIIVPIYVSNIYRKKFEYTIKLPKIETIKCRLSNDAKEDQDSTGERVRKSRLYLWIFSLVLIIGIFVYYNELNQKQEHEYLTSYTVQEFNNIRLKDNEIIQEFIAEQNDLHIFYVWLKNCSSLDSGIVKIKILDMEGKVYYEGQYALNELGNDGFCWVGGMQDSLKKGEKYELIIDTEDASSNVVIQAVKDTTLLDSMGRLTVNGIEEQDSALYMLQTYSPTTSSIGSIWVFLWIIAAVIGGVAIFINAKK